MTVYEEILSAAADFLGKEDSRLDLIVKAVYPTVISRLRPNVNPVACHDSIIYACVLLSVSQLRLLESNELSAFNAGTLKLEFKENEDSLVKAAYRLLQPWCDSGFALKGV